MKTWVSGNKKVTKDARNYQTSIKAKMLTEDYSLMRSCFVQKKSYNAKNDVIFSATFDDIPEHLQTVKCFQNKNSVMVWASDTQWKIALEIH